MVALTKRGKGQTDDIRSALVPIKTGKVDAGFDA
jgi:hypothetical protein